MSEKLSLKPIILPFYADVEEWSFVQSSLEANISKTSLSQEKKAYTSIINAVLSNLLHERPVSVTATKTDIDKIKKILSSLGLENLFIDALDIDNHASLLLAKEAILNSNSSNQEIEAERSWWRLTDILMDHQSYIKKLNKQIVGQKTLEHLVFEFYQDNGKANSYLLNGRIKNRLFEFSVKEYWHLRGRVKTGQSLYNSTFKDSFPLESLNPVFLDMYSPYEAQVLLEEKLKTFKEDLICIKLDLIKWTAFYRQSAIDKTEETIHSFVSKMKQLRIQAKSSLDIESEDKKQNFISRTFGNTSQIKAQKVKEIGAEYNALIENIHESLQLSDSRLNRWKEDSDILFLIGDAMQRIKSKRKMLLSRVDQDMVKLNPHVAKVQLEGSGQLQSISNRLNALFSELNKYKIFNTFWEDNTLDVLSRIAHFDQWETEISKVISNLDKFGGFYQWKKFFDILGGPSQELINTLIQCQEEDWITLFDSWYLSHLIGQQDITTPQEQELILALFRDANRVNVDKVKKNWTGTMKLQLEAFLKNNKSFRQWMDGKIPDVSAESKQELSAIFPIVLNTITEDNTGAIEKEVHFNLSEEEKGHHLLVSDEGERQLRFDLPTIPHGLLQSAHTERIQLIRQLANYIIETCPSFNLYQSNKTALLVFVKSQYEDLIIASYKDRFTVDEISDNTHLDKLTEALVDNSRQFHVIVQDKLLDGNGAQNILWEAILKGLLEKAGLTYHLIYSYNLFIYSNFISECVDSVSLQSDDSISTKSKSPLVLQSTEDQGAELDI